MIEVAIRSTPRRKPDRTPSPPITKIAISNPFMRVAAYTIAGAPSIPPPPAALKLRGSAALFGQRRFLCLNASMGSTCIDQLGRHVGEEVTLKGWLYNRRSSGKIHFLLLRDGSGICQCVASRADLGAESFELADH